MQILGVVRTTQMVGTILTSSQPHQRSRVETIYEAIVGRIDRGLIRAGERLPSIRTATQTFAVSKNTMVEAYDRLVASGRVESRPGSGFYVTQHQPKRAKIPSPGKVDAVDIVWLLREQLEKRYEVRIGDGRPPAAWMEGPDVGMLLRPVTRPGKRALPESYGSPNGLPALRERIALTLAERSINAEPAQVLLTQGANDALDMIVRHFVEPGDTVLVDNPGYYPLFGKLRLAKATLAGVRRNIDGPDLDDLEQRAATTGARLFFTQSLAHNPTGCSITLPVAYRLMQIATKYNLRIVDTDPFADVLPATSPRLAALDQLDRVIYVGTFAKTLSASLRSGYIAADPQTIGALADLKMITRANSSGYVEQIIYDLMISGRYRNHLKRLAGRIETATAAAYDSLSQLGLPIFGQPRGGFYMWCQLPPHIDDKQLSKRAADLSILLAPGSAFNPGESTSSPAMRVNIAYVGDARFASFMKDSGAIS